MRNTPWSGRALKLRRTIADLTQQELADALGVSDGTVSAWETEGREPDEDQIKAMARALGCKSDDFFREAQVR